MITVRKGSLKVKIFKRNGLVCMRWNSGKKDSMIAEYSDFTSLTKDQWTLFETSKVWWSRNILKVVVYTTFSTVEAAKDHLEKANP